MWSYIEAYILYLGVFAEVGFKQHEYYGHFENTQHKKEAKNVSTVYAADEI